MRIHVQNAPNDPAFAITPQMWQQAGGAGEVSFGDTEAAFKEALLTAEALVSSAAAVRNYMKEGPKQAPALKLIFCTSAGLDGLAPFDWLPPGVALLNNSGAHSARAGEYAAMALLMLAGQMPALIAQQHEGRWQKQFASVLAGRRLVVVGTGGLGGAAGRVARLFGMRTTGVRTSGEPHPDFDEIVATEDFDTVLPGLEFLLLAAPLTPQTRHMLDRRRLNLLPKGAHVINIGRGGLIEQEALCDVLDSGHLAGAVLDVFTPEPIPSGHRLWTTRNLIITPHCSADDPSTYASHSLAIFLQNLAAYERGEKMANVFDTERGY